MKNIILIVVMALSFTKTSNAQEKTTTEPNVISLEQTKGEFTQKEVSLKEGSYIFEISNNNVGHPVGFVLAPKSNPDQHIKSAYVTKVVDNNSKEKSNVTTLTKGEYVYFCPMNPTPQYTLIVE